MEKEKLVGRNVRWRAGGGKSLATKPVV